MFLNDVAYANFNNDQGRGAFEERRQHFKNWANSVMDSPEPTHPKSSPRNQRVPTQADRQMEQAYRDLESVGVKRKNRNAPATANINPFEPPSKSTRTANVNPFESPKTSTPRQQAAPPSKSRRTATGKIRYVTQEPTRMENKLFTTRNAAIAGAGALGVGGLYAGYKYLNRKKQGRK